MCKTSRLDGADGPLSVYLGTVQISLIAARCSGSCAEGMGTTCSRMSAAGTRNWCGQACTMPGSQHDCSCRTNDWRCRQRKAHSRPHPLAVHQEALLRQLLDRANCSDDASEASEREQLPCAQTRPVCGQTQAQRQACQAPGGGSARRAGADREHQERGACLHRPPPGQAAPGQGPLRHHLQRWRPGEQRRLLC